MSQNPRSWAVDAIGAAAFEKLATELSGAELQSLLLEVLQRRALRRQPKDLLAQCFRSGGEAAHA